jgi:hypothetical protein
MITSLTPGHHGIQGPRSPIQCDASHANPQKSTRVLRHGRTRGIWRGADGTMKEFGRAFNHRSTDPVVSNNLQEALSS